MRFKGFTAAILTVVMLMTLMPNVFAASFPDVTDKHSWAKEYIEDMVGRGLLKGYTDGTFKPDNAITKLEAVILASRIMGFTNEENADFAEAALKAFENDLSGYDIQYKKEVAYLLYWGALKLTDLPSYIGNDIKNTAMKRYEVAVLLTKVMGGEKEAQNNTMSVLDFSDDSQVPAAAKAYVQYVSDNGIMNGMENNRFVPMGEVTRAMMAAMMYRAEQAMGISIAEVHVASVFDNSFSGTVSGQASSKTFELEADTLINVDGLPSSVSNIKAGYDIRIHYQGEKIRLIEALASRLQNEVSGVISALANNSGVQKVTIRIAGSDQTATYVLDGNCMIVVDKTETIFTSLKREAFVKLLIKNNKVTKITAETKETTYNGTITEVDITGDVPAISFKLRDNSEVAFELMASAVIMRNGAADEFRNLAVGDSAEFIVSAGLIKKITATSVNKNIEGTIEEIVISSAPSITIKVNGVSKKYNVADSTVFYVQDEQKTIYDMRIGATASVSLKSENIDKIKISQTIMPSQMIGTVTAVNALHGVITMDTIDTATGKVSTATIVVKSNVKIIDNTTTRISALKGITAGRSIIALGAMDNYGTYSVTTIIITQ